MSTSKQRQSGYYDRYREHQKFYSSVEWTKPRDKYRKAHPLCEMCQIDGHLTPTQQVDHIVPLSQKGHKTDERNLQSLCKDHAVRKNKWELYGDTEQPETDLSGVPINRRYDWTTRQWTDDAGRPHLTYYAVKRGLLEDGTLGSIPYYDLETKTPVHPQDTDNTISHTHRQSRRPQPGDPEYNPWLPKSKQRY